MDFNGTLKSHKREWKTEMRLILNASCRRLSFCRLFV